MEERKPWDRMIDQNEPIKWYARFDRFRLMKPWERSVNAVFEEEEIEKNREKPRKKPTGNWYEIAEKWKWNERAETWDTYQREERDRQIALEEEEVLKSEYALKHKRIHILNELTKQLVEEAEKKNSMYIYSAKETKFNDGLYGMIDKYLASIASEKGERVKLTKSEVTGKDGGPIQIGRDPNLQLLTDEELAQAQRIALQLSSRQEDAE